MYTPFENSEKKNVFGEYANLKPRQKEDVVCYCVIVCVIIVVGLFACSKVQMPHLTGGAGLHGS